MKRKTTKEILAESFRELAEQKKIDKITVKEITDNCGYSSATFYRQFREKYDLIAWDYTKELEQIMSGVNGSGTAWRQTLAEAARFFSERKGYLANLFLHTSGMEAFIGYMREMHFRSLKNAVERSAAGRTVDPLTDMYIRVYVLGTVQFICEWILGQTKVSAEELAMVFEQTLPAPLQPYICSE